MSSYTADTNLKHNETECTGILLTNLGTSTALTVRAVRQYLAEFLADPRVVELPRLLWWVILHGFILRFRPRRSIKLYQKIWLTEGSPLLVYSRRLAEKIQMALKARTSGKIKVVLGMRYGEPDLAKALRELRAAGAKRIVILPLYPQYSASTTGSTFDAIAAELQTWRCVPELHFLQHYANHPAYIDALVNSITQHRLKQPRAGHLLFSFHGIPQKMCMSGDPYYELCLKTANLVATQLNLAPGVWSVAFQSRLGRAAWLKPYCDQELREMPTRGIKNVTVICPGFAVDCLETLEEIAMTNRAIFMQAGGESFAYIPALNDTDQHVTALLAVLDSMLKIT